MPESVSAAFSEPEDFGAAMRVDGFLNLFVTTPRQFRAQLTRISLNEIRLAAVEERVSRIAFVAVPANLLVVTFPIGNETAPILSGMRMTRAEFIATGPGAQFHARTDGASRWGTICISAHGLSDLGAALVDGAFPILSGTRRWRPPARAARELRSLHSATMRMAVQHPQALVDAEAAHGLEQQLLHAVLECLSDMRTEHELQAPEGHRSTMLRFEQALQRANSKRLSMTEICAQLQVQERSLRHLCAEHLGMSPTAYDRLRRMWHVRQMLRGSTLPSERVSAVARNHGFNDLGRFATNYRQTFGELPSSTLRRSRAQSIVDCGSQLSTHSSNFQRHKLS
jgi:AraC-like DNA-binding protein